MPFAKWRPFSLGLNVFSGSTTLRFLTAIQVAEELIHHDNHAFHNTARVAGNRPSLCPESNRSYAPLYWLIKSDLENKLHIERTLMDASVIVFNFPQFLPLVYPGCLSSDEF